jgi:hypothetical protein
MATAPKPKPPTTPAPAPPPLPNGTGTTPPHPPKPDPVPVRTPHAGDTAPGKNPPGPQPLNPKPAAPDPKAPKPPAPQPTTPGGTTPRNTPYVPPPATPQVDPYSGMPTAQRNAFIALKSQLSQYGLESLADKVMDFVKQGYENESLAYLVSQTPEYKQRFAANDVRIQNGLAPLAPAEYLSTERAYRSVLASSGLPSGFYDSPDDFHSLIGTDISPQELQERADHAFKFAAAQDPSVRDALKQYYGIDEAHLAAHFLDPTKAQSILNRQAQAATIGGLAAQQHLDIGRDDAEKYVDSGITEEQARSGLSNAGMVAPDLKSLGLRFGTSYSDADATDEFVGGLASARRKRETLSRSEQALFQGDSQESRAFGTDTSGSY